jgi:electron transfer flavoprotein alpha subunit
MPENVVQIDESLCVGCGQCITVCESGALDMAEGIAVVDDSLCTCCGECVPVCPQEALALPEGVEPQARAAAPAPTEAAEIPAPAQTAAAVEEAPAQEAAPAAASVAAEEEEPVAETPAPEEAPAKEVVPGRAVWVFVEQTDGRPAGVAWELLGEGAKLAENRQGTLCAAVLGHNVRHIAEEAIAYGARIAYLIDDPVLEHYRTQAYMHGMVSLIHRYQPEIVLLGATTTGRDLAGAVATWLRTGLTADCTGLSIDVDRGLLEQTRPAYGGNIMATILCEKQRPQMATVRPRVMSMPERDDSRTGQVVAEPLRLTEEQVAARVVEYVREDTGTGLRIEDAEVIVAGGRGLGSADGFNVLQGLADVLGGVVGGSRGAVDNGWISHDRQVGQTGRTVRPKLYVACGISGAIQHLVGMQNSQAIVAINSDPEAPIFKVATHGIVGDVYKVVPALTREFEKRLGRRGEV